MHIIKRGILYLIFLQTWIPFTWWFLTYTSLDGKDGQDSILLLPYLLIFPTGVSTSNILMPIYNLILAPCICPALRHAAQGFSFRNHPLSFLTKWKTHMLGVTERRSLGLAFAISSLVYLDLFRFLFNKFSLQYQDMSPWGREREPLHVRVILSLWKFVDHGGLERRKAFRVTSKEEIGRWRPVKVNGRWVEHRESPSCN